MEDGCRFSLAFSVPSAEPGPHRLVDPDSAYAITSAHPFEVTAETAPERRSGWATYEDRAGSLSLSDPPGWSAQESLTRTSPTPPSLRP